MNQASIKFGKTRQYGFTLLEVMIVTAIVAILVAFALPAYTDYITRGKLVEPTTMLQGLRVSMEQYYQDNRTYKDVSATILSPCGASKLPAMKYFGMTCVFDASTYTAKATGADVSTTGFVYTINNTNDQTSTVSPAWDSTGTTYACWIMKKGATC